jgi:hypothetical protein
MTKDESKICFVLMLSNVLSMKKSEALSFYQCLNVLRKATKKEGKHERLSWILCLDHTMSPKTHNKCQRRGVKLLC